VRVYYTASNGREITVGYWHPDDFFGLGGICADGFRITCADAVTACRILRIPYAELPQVTLRSPNLSLHLIRALSSRLRWVTIMMQAALTLPARARLAHFLLHRAKARGKPTKEGILIDEGWTHQAIADMLGCTRQTVTEVLNEFVGEGLVRVGRRKIYVVDRAALERT
jgi:CRP-like cAMP-binding protein